MTKDIFRPAIFGNLSDKVLVEHVYAALALNKLHHDGAGFFGDLFLHGRKFGLGIDETAGKRPEIFMKFLLSGRGERREARAAVKARLRG